MAVTQGASKRDGRGTRPGRTLAPGATSPDGANGADGFTRVCTLEDLQARGVVAPVGLGHSLALFWH